MRVQPRVAGCNGLLLSGSTKLIGMTKPDSSDDGTHESGEDVPPSTKNADETRSDGPTAESREERLKRIQADVAAGKYDSDDILDKALEIMLRKMTDSAE